MIKISKLLKVETIFKIKRFFRKESNFGICFDIDGVLARGPNVIPPAKKAIQKLVDGKNNWKYPVAFVTNSSGIKKSKAKFLTDLLLVEVKPDQVVLAPTPLQVLSSLHEKFCLVVGQGDVKSEAAENGFKNVCTLEDLSKAYPLLDMIDTSKRTKIFKTQQVGNFSRVEALVLLGESIHWEMSLQLLVDLLRTNGLPTQIPKHKILPSPQMPLVVCNFDLEYMSRSNIPRFGHGAFLTCLESLYTRITQRPMVYMSLLGKPTELTFRFAEYILSLQSEEIGNPHPLHSMYMVGDNPAVDIAGSNLYSKYIRQVQALKRQGCTEKDALLLTNKGLPKSRQIPEHPFFLKKPQTVRKMEGLLVGTGVYNEEYILGYKIKTGSNSTEDFQLDFKAEVPQGIFTDVNLAVDYILEKEERLG